jgi:hypothetical protein
MANSIYSQLSRALTQAAGYGQRSILYRGAVIQCAVLLGNTETKLEPGGLQGIETVHCKIPRSLVPIGNDGEPHTNERVVFPAVAANGLVPAEYKIEEVVAEEHAYNFTLVDPAK